MERKSQGAVRHGEPYRQSKKALLARLRRIEGQVRGIRLMVEQDRSCADVLQQIASMRSAADAVAMMALEEHIGRCLSEAVVAPNGESASLEITEMLRRYLRW